VLLHHLHLETCLLNQLRPEANQLNEKKQEVFGGFLDSLSNRYRVMQDLENLETEVEQPFTALSWISFCIVKQGPSGSF
jgi:hypothetical protein